jgi:hypothetical protein
MTSKSGTPRGEGALPLGLFLFFVVGWSAIFLVLPEWRANHLYVEGRCVLLDKRLVEDSSSGYRGARNSTYRPEFLIRYTVAGREYQAWTYDAWVLALRASTALRWPKERVLDSFTVGQEYPCWYDPADPSQVVLVRGYSWFSYGLALALGVSLLLIGTGVLRRLRGARSAAGGASGEGAAPTNGRERRPPITLCAVVDPDLGQAFNECVDSLRPKTTTQAVIEMLIERYVAESGKWPSAQPLSKQLPSE